MIKNIELKKFSDFDCFNLSEFCHRVESYLMVDHDYVEGSLVVALDGSYGSGKSTFIEMWKNDLNERRETDGILPIPFILNAWESDHCGDPLVAILASLITATNEISGSAARTQRAKIKEAAKDIGWFMTGLTNEFISKLAGIDILKAGDLADKKKNSRKAPTPDFITLYEKRVESLTRLKLLLGEYFGGEQLKIIIFVDELDRCRPDYAITYLETIKHVFDINGLAFVLAIDKSQLENSARKLFGEKLIIDQYFRKFFHRTIPLPTLNRGNYARFSKKLIEKFLIIEGKRNTAIDTTENTVGYICDLCDCFILEPRQIEEMFRILGYLTGSVNTKVNRKFTFAVTAKILLVACIRVSDYTIFKNIQNESNIQAIINICDIFMEKMDQYNALFWIAITLLAIRNNKTEGEISHYLLRKNIISDDQESLRQFFHGLYDNSRLSLSSIANSVSKLEQF